MHTTGRNMFGRGYQGRVRRGLLGKGTAIMHPVATSISPPMKHSQLPLGSYCSTGLLARWTYVGGDGYYTDVGESLENDLKAMWVGAAKTSSPGKAKRPCINLYVRKFDLGERDVDWHKTGRGDAKLVEKEFNFIWWGCICISLPLGSCIHLLHVRQFGLPLRWELHAIGRWPAVQRIIAVFVRHNENVYKPVLHSPESKTHTLLLELYFEAHRLRWRSYFCYAS